MDQEKQFIPDFILHGQLDLVKSVASDEAVKNGTGERRLIYGEITNGNEDEEGESLIAKALDFSYFDQQGFIKYEHSNEPTHIIGCPHERVTTPNGGTLIKGALFSGTKYADATWGLIQSIEKHNREYPEHQKTLGWSVEGQYTDDKIEKGGYRKAKVVNVVITPNPVNKSVYLRALSENHAIFAKSLILDKAMSATPTSTDLSAKTGVDAIAKENIDGEIKETAENIETGKSEDVKKDAKKKKESKLSKSKQRSSTMKFETIEAATKHFTDLGETDENATKLAKSFFPEEEDTDTGEDNALVEEVSGMKKALEGITAFLKKSKTPDNPEDVLGADDFDTIDNGDEGDFINTADTLLFMQKSIEDLTALVREKITYDVEHNTQMVKAIESMGLTDSKLAKAISTVQNSVTVGEGDKTIPLAKVMELFIKSRSGTNVDLSTFALAGEGDAITSTPTGDRMSWGDMQKLLHKGLASKVLTAQQTTMAEAAHHAHDFDLMHEITDLVKDD